MSEQLPKGIPYIIGNEAAERFSYYGMKCVLVVYMTQYLSGELMSEAEAKTWYHLFSTANYFFPVIGALIADIFWGKYKTIILLSLVYCGGHLALAIDETRLGLAVGLTLIAIGSGGIKPCVSAHVGDQFSPKNQHLIERVFSYFYLSINFGAFVSTLLTPVLLESVGPRVAFGVPGALMFLATFVFWLGRKAFRAVPPNSARVYFKDFKSKEVLSSLKSLIVLYLFIAIFWSLFDQTGSSWVLQAKAMDREIFGLELLPSQIQALNPILILLLVPVFTFVIYPSLSRRVELTPYRKIVSGMFLAASSFVVCALVQAELDSGLQVSILWQGLAYLLLTSGEVMVSITALEFSYTQAPLRMKSLIMGLFFLSVALGNFVTAGVNALLTTPWGENLFSGASYFWFFAGLMFVTAVVLAVVSRYLPTSRFIHPEVLETADLH